MQKKMSIKNANRILCAATAAMVAIQFLLVWIGIYDTLILLVASHGAIILITLFGIWLSDVDMKENFRFAPMTFKTFVLAFFTIICCFPIISLLNVLSMFFVENAVADVASDMFPYGLEISLLVMAVMPSISEELLVRGVIYHSYREKSPVMAWIASAVIFGMLHMNFNQMPYAIFLGIMMVIMMEASGSIVTSMCMHFFVNGISTWSGYVSQLLSDAASQADVDVEAVAGTAAEMQTTLMIMGIICIVMIPLICLLVHSTCKENGRKLRTAFAKQEPEWDLNDLPEVKVEQKVWDIWLILAILIMVLITALNTFA